MLIETEKQQFDKKPTEYDDSNKESLLTSLDFSNWPIPKKDIELVEKEIELGKKFLQQSNDLREYYKERKEAFNKKENLKSQQELASKSNLDNKYDLDSNQKGEDQTNRTTDVSIYFLFKFSSRNECLISFNAIVNKAARFG